MRKATDKHLLQLLRGAVLNQDVYAGVAGRNQQGDIIVPQIVYTRSSVETNRTLDHAATDRQYQYNVTLIASGYEDLADMEEAAVKELRSDINVIDVGGGFDSGDIESLIYQRVLVVEMQPVPLE